jgi:hypothetical protein
MLIQSRADEIDTIRSFPRFSWVVPLSASPGQCASRTDYRDP